MTEQQEKYHRWLIYGPTGHGKTLLGATASRQFPEQLPCTEKRNLPDVVYFQFDPGGTESLEGFGLKPVVIDFSMAKDMPQLRQQITNAIQKVQTLLKQGPLTIIVDTVSTLDMMVQEMLGRMGMESRNLFGQLLDFHKWFYGQLRVLPCDVLYLSHSKVIAPDKGDIVGQLKVDATALPGEAKIAPALTGKGKVMYESACSVVWYLYTEGSKDKRRRVALTQTNEYAVAKCRWPFIPDEVINPNLRKIFGEIEAFRNKV